jgi:hypothetical protein
MGVHVELSTDSIVSKFVLDEHVVMVYEAPAGTEIRYLQSSGASAQENRKEWTHTHNITTRCNHGIHPHTDQRPRDVATLPVIVGVEDVMSLITTSPHENAVAEVCDGHT